MLIAPDNKNFKKTGVYKITNPSNNNFYIGSTSISFHKRFINHRRLLHYKTNPCTFLQNAYNKHKNVNFTFEILEVCSKEICVQREQYYIDTLKPKYNLCKNAASSLGRKPTKIQHMTQLEAQRTFTDEQIIAMFNLYNQGMKVYKIAKILNCKPNNISSIVNFPKRYELVKEKYNFQLTNKKPKYVGKFLVTKPNGEEVVVENLTKFAKENNLEASNLNRCANNILKTSKGHKVKKIF